MTSEKQEQGARAQARLDRLRLQQVPNSRVVNLHRRNDERAGVDVT